MWYYIYNIYYCISEVVWNNEFAEKLLYYYFLIYIGDDMKIYLNKITGVDDSLVSLLMSKRSWTREKEMEIREKVKAATDENGFLTDRSEDFAKDLAKLKKYGIECGHTTLLRFIDLSFTVEGLHRGAQDDFDSHAKRLDSRIVRASTRLGNFDEGEMSDFYKDKILFDETVAKIVGIELPETVEKDGVKFVKTAFGYVREDLKDDKDAKRGLYPLSIPSNFIFKVQYPELCHIVQHRDKNSFANPELKEMIEMLKSEVTEKFPLLGENLTKVKMQNYQE